VFSWSHLGLVAAGGALGTAARAGLTLAFAAALGPAFVPVVNVVGAFALGVVVGLFARRARNRRSGAWQMFLGTGVLGGFTTYSALALEASDPALVLWGVGTVVVGTAAAWGGLAVGRGRRRA
jgi:CrcB protein